MGTNGLTTKSIQGNRGIEFLKLDCPGNYSAVVLNWGRFCPPGEADNRDTFYCRNVGWRGEGGGVGGRPCY